jgi:two-component system, NarL family, nitrate/nitrite response regulator NarL
LQETIRSWPHVLVLALRDIDSSVAYVLTRATGNGVLPLVLLDNATTAGVALLADLPQLGLVFADEVTPETLGTAIARMVNGEIPVPARLVKSLLMTAREAGNGARDMRDVQLTPREEQALILLVEGLSNHGIAGRLKISEHGAKRLVANVLAKVNCSNRTMAVAETLRSGLYHECLRHQDHPRQVAVSAP